jgi:hypothetical protein
MRKIYFLFLFLISIETKAQQMLDGPDGPDVNYNFNGTAFEFELYNPTSSNNYMENYMEMDIPITSARPDSFYRFQGYLIYQLTSLDDLGGATMNQGYTLEEFLNSPSYSRLVAQSDLADTSINFTNNYFDSTTMQCSAIDVISNASNAGTQLNYTINMDAFTNGPFIPGNQYCFIFLSYAVNGYHQDTTCMLPKPVRLSGKSSSGALISFCLDPATAGINDSQMNNVNIFYHDGIKIISERNGIFKLISSDGKILHNENIIGNSEIITYDLASGIYIFQYESENSIKTGKIFIPKN